MGKLQSKTSSHPAKYRANGSVEETGLTRAPQRHDPVHTDGVTAVAALTPDLCVSGGRDKSVAVCSWRSRAELWRFLGHQREVTKVISALASNRVFSASRDKTVMMWELHGAPGPSQCFTGHDLVVTGLAVSPDASWLCTGSRDNTVCKWDIETGGCLGRAAISRNLVTHLCWVPGEPYVIQTSEDKTIRGLEATFQLTLVLERGLLAGEDSTGTLVAVSSPGGVWDSRELRVAHTFPAKRHIQTSCDVSQDGRLCLSTSSGCAGEGGEATNRRMIWDRKGPLEIIHSNPLPEQGHPEQDPQERLQLWDLRQTRDCVREYRGHFQTTTSCLFLPRGLALPHSIATSSYDSTVKVWEQDTGACLATLGLEDAGPLAACDSSTLLCASLSSGIHVLRLREQAVMALEEVAVL